MVLAMLVLEKLKPALAMIALAFSLALALSGCASGPQLPKGMVGRLGKYDYSPSIIQTGNVRQFWWCGLAKNPAKPSQESDAILYETMNMVTGAVSPPQTVLAETPNAWDSWFTCNPKVIGGTFRDPLGDGQVYSYALYYVGISHTTNNYIGVAFSKDGISWKKYPTPVIYASSPDGYGVGQPALYNTDHKSGITMFYEDSNPAVHHIKATSTDGVHFTVQGTITAKGLDAGCPGTWGDLAYDAKTGYWYGLFDRSFRDPSTTGGVDEQGQLGEELYRIPDNSLLTGDTPWELLTTVDTNATGFESNFIGGLVRDEFGTVNVGSYPTIEMYISVSDPQPGWNDTPKAVGKSANPSTWDIAPAKWVPNKPLKSLSRYYNNQTYLVTNGFVNQYAGFQQQSMLGHVYESPQAGASTPLYGCINEDTDYFVSLDSKCEGKRILGRNGFAYAKPVSNLTLLPLYRCQTGDSHFASTDAKCEGGAVEGLIAYVLP